MRVESSQRSSIAISPVHHRARIGIVCLSLAIGCWSLSFALHCSGRAALVGGFGFVDGGLLGLCLALVTRARRPIAIYAWLLIAGLTLYPIWHDWPLRGGWPIGDPATIHPWSGAPDLIYNYYGLLRFCLFVLGLPYPFARFGHHAPDRRSDAALFVDSEETPETKET